MIKLVAGETFPMSYTNFYLRHFPHPIQKKINDFGTHFTLKCGDIPKSLYNLQDIEDLLVLYQEISSEYWKDENVQLYSLFFADLIEFYSFHKIPAKKNVID